SRRLHRPWVHPPATMERFQAYLARLARPTHVGYFVLSPEGELAGVVNVSEIVRGAFHSAYLGYYAFVPHESRGFMTAGLGLVIARAFREYGLHRLEANIQPDNRGSLALVK